MTDGSELPRTGVRGSRVALVTIVLAGAAVAVALGLVGTVAGGPRELPTWGFSSVQTFKAWLATIVLGLVAVQLFTALWIYGRLPRLRPGSHRVHVLHRVSGAVAFLVSLPVAFYCLYGFGFDATTPRTLVHSVAGCAFYGAFTAKMLALRSSRLPGWLLPVLGGTVFSLFVLLWTVSAAWWFRTVGITS
ncbi:DUF6529 family protein [Actinosynnema sp. CA-248983]